VQKEAQWLKADAATPLLEWLDGDRANIPTRAIRMMANLPEGLPHPGRRGDTVQAATVGELAALPAHDLLVFYNCGRATLQAMGESLERAGVPPSWGRPFRPGRAGPPR